MNDTKDTGVMLVTPETTSPFFDDLLYKANGHDDKCWWDGCELCERHSEYCTCGRCYAAKHKPKDAGVTYTELDLFTANLSLAGTQEPIPSTIMRDDGATILYEGKLNSVYGQPGTGKSWFALMACKATVDGGGRVLWWDFEDMPETLARRAAVIGFTDVVNPTKFRYAGRELKSETTETMFAKRQAISWLESGDSCGLVVIDAAEQAGCPADGSDVGQWFNQMVKPFRASGIGVLLLDHVPKRQDRPTGAIGSQSKLARLDGVGIYLSGTPWTQHDNGRLTLTIQKDRQGQVRTALGKPMAYLTGDWIDGAFTYAFVTPQTSTERLSDALLDLLYQHTDGIHGQRQLRDALGCSPNALSGVLKALIADGMITADKDGRAMLYKVTDKAVEDDTSQ